MAGDSIDAGHSSAADYIMVDVDPSAYDCIVVVVVAAIRITSMVVDVVKTAVEVVVVPLVAAAAAVAALSDGIVPSHTTCPLFFPKLNNMHNIPYPHS